MSSYPQTPSCWILSEAWLDGQPVLARNPYRVLWPGAPGVHVIDHGFHSIPLHVHVAEVPHGMGIVYSSRIKDPGRLDRIVVREWLTRVFGRRVYENIWEPLLRSKLGDAREKTSAAFIWATINRLYGARGSGGSKKERMGHVSGGLPYHSRSCRERID